MAESYIYGVWQDGLLLTYRTYGNSYGPVFLGTHVANDLYMALAVYGTYGSYYSFADWTYGFPCSLYDSTYTMTYAATYNVTYSAMYYRNEFANVRGIGWV